MYTHIHSIQSFPALKILNIFALWKFDLDSDEIVNSRVKRLNICFFGQLAFFLGVGGGQLTPVFQCKIACHHTYSWFEALRALDPEDFFVLTTPNKVSKNWNTLESSDMQYLGCG